MKKLNNLSKEELVQLIELYDNYNEDLVKTVKTIQERTNVAAAMILDTHEANPIPVNKEGKPKVNWIWLITNGIRYIKLIIDLINVIVKGKSVQYKPTSLLAKAFMNAEFQRLPQKPEFEALSTSPSKGKKKQASDSKGRK